MSIKKLFWSSAIVLVAVLVFTLTSYPQTTKASSVDFFLTLDGIKGSSNATGHKDNIEVSSWSFGASNPTSVGSGSAGAGKVTISSFNFIKKTDKSSPQLFIASQSGTHIKKATLSVRFLGSEFFTVNFEDIIISSYGMSSGGDRPLESISFSYGKVSIAWPKSLTN